MDQKTNSRGVSIKDRHVTLHILFPCMKKNLFVVQRVDIYAQLCFSLFGGTCVHFPVVHYLDTHIFQIIHLSFIFLSIFVGNCPWQNLEKRQTSICSLIKSRLKRLLRRNLWIPVRENHFWSGFITNTTRPSSSHSLKARMCPCAL